jgi:hypothetical protein
MVVKVLSRIGQALAHPFDGLSLAEGSMLLRLRRASIALLCLVGAVGLSLVVFISQLGWPDVLSGPLPGGPAKIGRIHDAVALQAPAVTTGRAVRALGGGSAAKTAKAGGKRRAPGTPDASHLGRSHGLTNATEASPPPPAAAPAPPTTAPVPTGSAPVVSAPPSPSPTTAAVESEPPSGAIKASNDSGRAAALAAAKSHGQQSASGKDPSTSKTSEQASAKARGDARVATPPAPSPPPPAAANPAAAKEAADAAKAGQDRH